MASETVGAGLLYQRNPEFQIDLEEGGGSDLQVVGMTMLIQASDNTEGRSLRPTTSVATGPNAGQ